MLTISAVPASAARNHPAKPSEADGYIVVENKDRKSCDQCDRNEQENKHTERNYQWKSNRDFRTPRVLSVSSGRPGTGHRFPYGQCTWYVSSKKYIPWSGNAGTWLDKARMMGFSTGRVAKKGAVAVFGGNYYGHVAVVEEVQGDRVAISEMNYKGFGRMNYRNISAYDPKLKGFIY